MPATLYSNNTHESRLGDLTSESSFGPSSLIALGGFRGAPTRHDAVYSVQTA